MISGNENRKLKVFVASSTEAHEIKRFIMGILENNHIEPIDWKKINQAGEFGLESLLNISNEVDGAVIIATCDDKIWHREGKNITPRDNILFEMGLFIKALGRKRAPLIFVQNDKMKWPKIPTDLLGLNTIRFYYGKKIENEDRLRGWIHEFQKGFQTNGNETLPYNDFAPPKRQYGAKHTTPDYDFRLTATLPFPESELKLEFEPKTVHSIEIVYMPKGTYYRIKDDVKITIDTPFSISKYLITQSLYSSIMGYNPSHFQYDRNDNLPVENVTFFEAINFCNRLSVKDGLQEVYIVNNNDVILNSDVIGYRLPFEIEWEHVLGYSIKEIEDEIDEIAWYRSNSKSKTQPIGTKKENKYGISDLVGNVWEWCFDDYKANPYKMPTLENKSELKVIRGGSFADFKTMFRKDKIFREKRYSNDNSKLIGVRVILQNKKGLVS